MSVRTANRFTDSRVVRRNSLNVNLVKRVGARRGFAVGGEKNRQARAKRGKETGSGRWERSRVQVRDIPVVYIQMAIPRMRWLFRRRRQPVRQMRVLRPQRGWWKRRAGSGNANAARQQVTELEPNQCAGRRAAEGVA